MFLKNDKVRQKPLTEKEYRRRSRPKGAFAEVWTEEEGLPYSCHNYKVWEVVAARAIKEEK